MARLHRSLALLLPALSVACVDGTPVSPSIESGPLVGIPAMECVIDVEREDMTCAPPEPVQNRLAIAANRMIGGQDVYVKVANSGNSYNSGTQIFQTSVTVQNLLQAPLGTSDGSTVDGIKLYFGSGPTPYGTSTGEVTVNNPTGYAYFTEAGQAYFHYLQILQPMEISDAMVWKFNVPSTARTFRFVIYVSAPQADETESLLDKVWQGTASSDWTDVLNWRSALVPDSASSVSVPAASVTTLPNMPVLSANTQITHLRVGSGSTLGLGGDTLTAWGSVDAPGTISNGTLWMRGSNTLLAGTVPMLLVNGSVTVQDSTAVTGWVTVVGGVTGGSLTFSNFTPVVVVNPNP